MSEFKLDKPEVLFLAGGTMKGGIIQPLAPIDQLELTNKDYVDSLVASGVPDATPIIKGKLQLSGDLTGTASTPTIANLAITNAKMANMSSPSQLKGSGSVTSSVTDISIGPNLSMIGSTLNVNVSSFSGSFLPLAGGTMSGAISQPVAPLAGNDLTNKTYVDAQIVNVTVPDASPITKGKVQLAGDLTGTAASPLVANLAITTGKLADHAVTNIKLINMSGTSQLKGSSSTNSSVTDITLGSNLIMSGTILNVNANSLPFLPLAGGTMSGAISQPVAPLVGNDLTNKTYVDGLVTPDATTLIKGKVQLAGDLTGTAASPLVANLAITTGKLADNAITNSKLANLSGVSQLKGSSSASTAATDISLGTGLSMSGTTLSVNTSSLSGTFLPLAGGTMSGAISQPVAPLAGNDLTNKTYVDGLVTPDATTLIKGKVQLAGDLTGTAASPLVANLAITTNKINDNAVTNLKLAAMAGPSQLKGSGTGGNTTTDIALGSNLVMSGTTLNVNTTALSGTFLPLAGGTMSGAISQPVAPLVGNDLTNKTYVDGLVTPDATTLIKGKVQLAGDLTGTAASPLVANLAITTGKLADNAITNSKMANMSGVSQLKGSGSGGANAADISLGTGLNMSGTTLSVDSTTLNKAGNAQFGVVQFDPTGDLTQTSANSGIGLVKSGAITNAKLAVLGGTSQLKGSSSASTAATDITLGTGLSMSGSVLNINTGALRTKNSSVVRTITTSTGATGFQVSSTLPSMVYYSIRISTTISVGGTSTGTIFLEVAPTNSAAAGDWVIDAQVSNSQSFAGLITLSSTQVMTYEVSTYVPAGFFVKIRSTSSGTTAFTYITGTEIIG
jgi:hypothetical protein